MLVVKRDGKIVEFDPDKILESIKNAALAVECKDDTIQERAKQVLNIKNKLIESGFSPEEAEAQAEAQYQGYIEDGQYTEYNEDEAIEVLDMVTDSLDNLDEDLISTELIQEFVEKALMITGHSSTAKEYIIYYSNRERIREMNTSLMKSFENLTFGNSKDVETKRENANIDGDSAMGTMLKYGSEGAKKFNLLYVVPPEESEAHKNGDIHIHDLDFLTLTETCVSKDTKLVVKHIPTNDIRVVEARFFDKFLDSVPDDSVVKLDDFQILSYTGFTNIINCVRHPSSGKRVVRVNTDNSYVDITDNHRVSINNNGMQDVKATDLKVGDSIINPNEQNLASLSTISLIDLFGKQSVRNYDTYHLDITQDRDKLSNIRSTKVKELLNVSGNYANKPICITSINEINYNGYVYDFETSDNHFFANGILVHNCCQIDLEKLFSGGFNTGHGFLREPSEIRSYGALCCIAIQSNQNDQHGGQSVPAFDYYMAPGVAKSFAKNIFKILDIKYPECSDEQITDKLGHLSNEDIKSKLKEYVKEHRLIMNEDGYNYIRNLISEHYFKDLSNDEINAILDKAKKITDNDTHQSMEAVVHNLNSMHSRAGAQVPFSSLNFGTDTSEEGRMVSFNFLKATDEGLGNGETPIFPISIFKEKAGVSYNPEDPNYDLWKEACRVSAKRLFPNFSNLDAPYNAQYYREGDVDTEVAYMGCRTRVVANVYNPSYEKVTGRGNLSFTTINLPRLGLKANGDVSRFFEMLDDMLELVHHQLLSRFKVQCRKHPRNYPFLMGQGVWIGSDKLNLDDDITEILKNGTLTVGFIGLAECLKALIGKHHGESDEAQQLGLRIVGHMREMTDKWSQEEKMNYSLIATPAEGLAGRFTRIDKKKFGIINGVTDREYYTNSFHVPVYYHINAFRKIDIEAPYHALTNGGHISYIELDGDPTKNLKAFERVVRYMHDKGIGYGAVNHAIDRDPICGYTGIIDDVCPRCGRREGEPMTEEMWQKIKGYPSTANAKYCGTCGDIFEEEERVPNPLD